MLYSEENSPWADTWLWERKTRRCTRRLGGDGARHSADGRQTRLGTRFPPRNFWQRPLLDYDSFPMDQQNALTTVPPAADSPPALPSKEEAIKSFARGGSGDGSIFQQLTSNPFFTAGFGLAGLGAALRIGQQGLRRGGELLKRRMLVDLEITRHDESYPWVLNWMTRQYQKSLSETAENVYVHITDLNLSSG